MIIADPGREHEAAIRLGRIGFDHVVGILQDGLHSLAARPELTATTERVSAAVAAERLQQTKALAVDVRAPGERDAEGGAGQHQHPAESPVGARWRNCRAIGRC